MPSIYSSSQRTRQWRYSVLTPAAMVDRQHCRSSNRRQGRQQRRQWQRRSWRRWNSGWARHKRHAGGGPDARVPKEHPLLHPHCGGHPRRPFQLTCRRVQAPWLLSSPVQDFFLGLHFNMNINSMIQIIYLHTTQIYYILSKIINVFQK